MISEESCDTEDWKNDADNSTLITRIMNMYSDRKQSFETVIIFHNITSFYCIFDQIKLFKINYKILLTPNFELYNIYI